MFPSSHEMFTDLANAVSTHEQVRANVGPGIGAMMDDRYVIAHRLMSKLSRTLGTAISLEELKALDAKYSDLVEHEGITTIIAMSC